MRIARIATPAGPAYARADGDTYVPCEDTFAAFAASREPRPTGAPPVPAAQAEVLAPCEPRVVVGIAQNGPDAPLPVQAWLKSPRTVVPSGTGVQLRRNVGRVIAEGEVAVVIGRPIDDGLDLHNAHEYVLGVTAVNDVTNPDRNAVDVRNFEGKGGAAYTPLGPFVETDVDLALRRRPGRPRGDHRRGSAPCHPLPVKRSHRDRHQPRRGGPCPGRPAGRARPGARTR